MKFYLPLFIIVFFYSCQPKNTNQSYQDQLDSLRLKLENSYKPGFGSFMSSIQVHHNKLWFAGKNQNWQLADFEIHEIDEGVEDILKFLPERIESKKMHEIIPALDSVRSAIKQKHPGDFEKNYILLTQACNDCHKATNFEFNRVKVPDTPPFSNQEFGVRKD